MIFDSCKRTAGLGPINLSNVLGTPIGLFGNLDVEFEVVRRTFEYQQLIWSVKMPRFRLIGDFKLIFNLLELIF